MGLELDEVIVYVALLALMGYLLRLTMADWHDDRTSRPLKVFHTSGLACGVFAVLSAAVMKQLPDLLVAGLISGRLEEALGNMIEDAIIPVGFAFAALAGISFLRMKITQRAD